MTKTELIAQVANELQVTKKNTAAAVDKVLEVIMNTVASGEKVALVGFGTFEAVERAEREGVNPQTKEKITIAASKAPKFKASKTFKEAVNA